VACDAQPAPLKAPVEPAEQLALRPASAVSSGIVAPAEKLTAELSVSRVLPAFSG